MGDELISQERQDDSQGTDAYVADRRQMTGIEILNSPLLLLVLDSLNSTMSILGVPKMNMNMTIGTGLALKSVDELVTQSNVSLVVSCQ